MSKHCSINFEPLQNGEVYSRKGLRQLAAKLTQLMPLNFTSAELQQEAISRADKMSIQGIQPKLSAVLKVKQGKFELVANHGRYIIKPPNPHYKELPANEALTLSMAAAIGIETPAHGLIADREGNYSYFIKRFDRYGHKNKRAVEDFAQLSNKSRETKYQSSMEQVVNVIERYCSFPLIEKRELLKRTLFNFLCGNEDMHLKNYSLITINNKIQLAPAYDFLNTSIVLSQAREEIALPIKGKKNNLNKNLLLVYFAKERLGLNQKVIDAVCVELSKALPLWEVMIKQSYLTPSMQQAYSALLHQRAERLELR